ALAAVHQEPDDVVLQMDAVEHDVGPAGAGGADGDPTGPGDAPVVEHDGVGNEQLGAAGRQKGDSQPETRTLKVPDDAVLDVQGRGDGDVNSDRAGALPVDHQSAQADDVADARADGEAEYTENARLSGAVIRDVDRFADRHRAVVAGVDNGDL